MIIYTLLFCLLTAFSFHILIIVMYIKNKDNIYLFWFLATVALNMGIALALIILALTKPHLILQLNLKYFFWLLSGFFTILLLCLKVAIFRNVYRRAKDPKWYHVNYFGKKVYEKGVVKQSEFIGVFISLPFFLIIGAFFVSRLITMIMFGHI
jgi:hypothetical protein